MTALKVYVSEKANEELLQYLEREGYEIFKVKKKADVHEAVACHPDIYYCQLPSGIYEGDPGALSYKYPGDVLYNAAVVGKYFICSRFTSDDLKDRAVSLGLVPVTVAQGYVKCNLAVLDESHVITEDRGIAKALARIPGIECLLIDPGEVLLPGFNHGFIGGACGRVGDRMVFNGDLSAHSRFKEIKDLCTGCGLECVYFESYHLTDIGSILEEII